MTNCQTQIANMDVLEWCKREPEVLHHAMLCDPPYHLTSIVKRFGKEDSAPAQYGKDGVYSRASKGFMGQEWDGGDIAFQPETWAAFLPHLHPGAMIIAFAGTRGYHRMACAIEDAGYILHPMMVWTFSTGFPKATRIDTQIDKAAGVAVQHGKAFNHAGKGSREDLHQNAAGDGTRLHEPTTDLAKAWAGHRYGGQSLKPALEPICMFQKPFAGRPIESITATGAGTINIEAGRVRTSEKMQRTAGMSAMGQGSGWNPHNNRPVISDSTTGRWPSNFLLDEESAMLLGAQSGNRPNGYRLNESSQRNSAFHNNSGVGERGHNDSGTAARFFFQSNWQAEEHDPFFYCAKSGRLERDAGLEGFELRPKSGHIQQSEGRKMHGDTETFPCRNNHPCIKPVRLTKYLASLLSSPPEYAPRRILVPFSGSGSEMVGCILSGGWEFVQGIELSSEYTKIAEARIKFWKMNSGLFESLTEDEDDAPIDAQETLF